MSLYRFVAEGLSKHSLLTLLLLLLATIGVTPLLYSRPIIMTLWCIVIVFTSISSLGQRTSASLYKIWLMSVAYMAICVLYKVMDISSAGLGYCLLHTLFFLPCYSLIVFTHICSDNKVKFLFHAISFIIALNIADSIRLTFLYPMEVAFQSMAEELEMMGVTGLNLGGSMFVNMSVLFLGVMMIAFLNTRIKTEKIVFGIYIAITFWFIVMCSAKASAIVLAIFAVITQYLVFKGERNRIAFYILLLCMLVLFNMFFKDIIYFIADFIDNERITTRLLVFAADDTGAATQGNATLEARADLWIVSVNTWLSSLTTFFFGIGEHNYLEFVSTAASGIGNHSDLLDVFARYGIIGGLLLYGILIKYYKWLLQIFESAFKNYISTFFLLLILMGVTKRFISGEEAIVIFMLLPLCLMYMKTQTN